LSRCLDLPSSIAAIDTIAAYSELKRTEEGKLAVLLALLALLVADDSPRQGKLVVNLKRSRRLNDEHVLD
jgi:hypothetical protein